MSGQRRHPLVALAFFVGAALGFCFLSSSIGWAAVPIAGAVCTALWAVSALTGSASRAVRCLARTAGALVGGLYVLWVYLALTFGTLLAWTVPTWGWVLTALATLLVVATWMWRRPHAYVPLALPLGIWIAVVLSGWVREEDWVRCDDFLALNEPVKLVVPAQAHFGSCRAGEIRPAGRFPRTFWQAPDGERVVFTTQGAPVPGGLDGAVCEARLEGDTAPRCVGRPINKSQGLIDLPDQGRLLVLQWGLRTPAQVSGAVVLELPRSEGIRVLAEHWFDYMLGEGFYEPRNQTLFMFSDKMDGIHRVRLPRFDPEPTIPITFFTPGAIRYDAVAGEGVACGNRLATAIRGEPFAARNFSDGNASLIEKLSFSWGCDWNETERKVYVAVPNLGLLVKLDYDSGLVEKRWFVGPGMRAVAYDPVRRRAYLTDFLRGYVVAFDERSERVVDRWFVGRYSRWVQPTPDGRALLATSNLGIVRISLDAVNARPH